MELFNAESYAKACRAARERVERAMRTTDESGFPQRFSAASYEAKERTRRVEEAARERAGNYSGP